MDSISQIMAFIVAPGMFLIIVIYALVDGKENPAKRNKYQVRFELKSGKFQIDNIKRGASIIGSAGSGKTESIVYGFLKHFRKESFCGIIHDYKDFELTEIAYPLFKDSDIPFRVISFDKITHRVNPIAPCYLENEESVNEVSRVLIIFTSN